MRLKRRRRQGGGGGFRGSFHIRVDIKGLTVPQLVIAISILLVSLIIVVRVPWEQLDPAIAAGVLSAILGGAAVQAFKK